MQLNLNMLSPQKKLGLTNLVNYIYTKNILAVVAIVTSLLAISLVWSWMLLVDKFRDLSQNAVSINREYSDFGRSIRQINRTVRNINQSSKNYLPALPKINDLIEATPQNISISSIDYNRETQEIIIAGTAADRDVLIKYEENIKKISWLDNVVFPLSQFFQKTNIQFTTKAKLKSIPLPASFNPPTNRKQTVEEPL